MEKSHFLLAPFLTESRSSIRKGTKRSELRKDHVGKAMERAKLMPAILSAPGAAMLRYMGAMTRSEAKPLPRASVLSTFLAVILVLFAAVAAAQPSEKRGPCRATGEYCF